MQHIDKNFFKSFTISFNGEDYFLLSYEKSVIIDQILNEIPYSRNSLGEANLSVSMIVKSNKVLIKSITYCSNKMEKVKFLNKSFHKTGQTFILENLNYELSNAYFVLVKDYINQDIVKTPYFLPYDFATIVIFFQGDFYNISTLLNELLSIDFSIYLEFKNPKIALLKYNEIVSKYDLPFSFNDIFPFEDYYEYKIFNKGDYYGVPKA